jgi:hypothetical protein
MSALLAARRPAQADGGWLRLIAVSRCVRRVIEITGLQDALAMPRRSPPAVTARQAAPQGTGREGLQ